MLTHASARIRTRRALVALLAMLLLIVFCSRTIGYMVTPKVRFSPTKGGILGWSFIAKIDAVLSEAMQTVALPIAMEPKPLVIAQTYVAEKSHVVQGQKLLRFHQAQGDWMINYYQELLSHAQVKLANWEIQAKEAQLGWSESLADLARQIKQASRTRKAELQARNEVLEEQQALYIEKGIFADTSREILQNSCHNAAFALEALMQLKQDGWVVYAPQTGVVYTPLSSGQAYAGLSPLALLLPETAPFSLMLSLEAEANVLLEPQVQATFSAKTHNGDLPLVVEQLYVDAQTIRIQVSPQDAGTIRPEQVSEVRCIAHSSFADVLIPSAAVSDGQVYVLVHQDGAWGSEYSVRRVAVQTGLQNHEFTQILRGVNKQDNVVTAWDRPLNDGANVMLPLE